MRSLLVSVDVDSLVPIADAAKAAHRRRREDEERIRDVPGERKGDGQETTVRTSIASLDATISASRRSDRGLI
jgi:hypothetical protein